MPRSRRQWMIALLGGLCGLAHAALTFADLAPFALLFDALLLLLPRHR